MDKRSTAAGEEDLNGIDWLLFLRKKYGDPVDFVNALVGKIRSSAIKNKDLQDIVGGMRSAAEVYLAQTGRDDSTLLCSFCGNSIQKVRDLMVGTNSAICDECAISALKTICRKPGHRLLRFAYTLFELTVQIGYWVRAPWER